LREKAVALTELIVAFHDERLAPLGFRLASPRDPQRRGAHVSLVRLGVPPLYTSFTEVHEALERLAALVERGDHRDVDSGPLRVT
jgi:kynureninase